MPSGDGAAGAETTEAEAEELATVDEARSALLEALTSELGDSLVASHLEPGRDLWIRVATDSWTDTADYLRNRQRFRFFDWLSAIDWKPSPFGRSLDAAVDAAPPEAELTEFSSGDENSRDQAGAVGQGDAAAAPPEAELTDQAGAVGEGDTENDGADDEKAETESEGGYTGTGADGVTGGATRFQVFARVYNLSTGLGLTLKADVPPDRADGSPSIGTWIHTYPGAAWHERETHEMFGISFIGNNDMRNLYLPTDFEGHPLRKDYPLLARLVKPWPGIVDVEPMPEVEAAPAEAEPTAAADAESSGGPPEGGDGE